MRNYPISKMPLDLRMSLEFNHLSQDVRVKSLESNADLKSDRTPLPGNRRQHACTLIYGLAICIVLIRLNSASIKK